jgi:predicted phage terminase large subunit-like protein
VRRSAEELAHGRATVDFEQFVRLAWSQVETAPLEWEPYLSDVCAHLQAVVQDRITKLIVNIPPRHLKSTLVSVMLPAWIWIERPAYRIMSASHTERLALSDATRTRELVESDWYRRWFRSAESPFLRCREWHLSDDQNTKALYKTSLGGHRASFGVDSKLTGFGGDLLLIDDPLDAATMSDGGLDNVIDWHDRKMMTRFNDPRNPREILVMQRLHEKDLTGHLLRSAPGKYQHLCLPAMFDPARAYSTRTTDGVEFRRDRRVVEGDALAPKRMGVDVLVRLQEGFADFEGQYQQRPVAREGGIIKRDWFKRRWVLSGDTVPIGCEGVELPDRLDNVRAFVDAAFTASAKSDRVAIVVLGSKGPNQFVLDTVWDRMTFLGAVDAIKALKARWPMLTTVGVEKAANGHAIIDTLSQHMPGVYGIKATDKVARINAASGYLKAGNLILPAYAPWVSNAISESCNFPRGQHDDWIDAVSYGLLEILGANRPPDLRAINGGVVVGYNRA